MSVVRPSRPKTAPRNNPQVAQLLAQAQAQSKARNLDQAVLLYQQALKLVPGHPAVLAGLAHVELKAGRAESALSKLDEVLAAGYRTPVVFNDRGLLFQMLGRWEDAEAAYQEAAALGDHDTALMNLGVLHAQRGAFEEAERLFRMVIAKGRPSGDVWANLGSVLAEQGHPDDARDAFTEALRRSPGITSAVKGLELLDLGVPGAVERARQG